MRYCEKVITVLIATWPLTTAPVIVVKSGATYADEMDAWWRMNHPQLCAIHATLLSTQMNAWRLTRKNVEGRAHLCVTPCCSVLIAMSSCAITKKRLGLNKHTCSECYCFNCKFIYYPKRTGTSVTCALLMQPGVNRGHHINLSFMILRACCFIAVPTDLIS